MREQRGGQGQEKKGERRGRGQEREKGEVRQKKTPAERQRNKMEHQGRAEH